MTEPFRKGFRVRWGDVDFNGHLRNTAYLDTAGDVRTLFFEAHGFPMDEFSRLRIGPVIFRDEVEYSRELRLLEPYEVSLVLALPRSEDFETIARSAGRGGSPRGAEGA